MGCLNFTFSFTTFFAQVTCLEELLPKLGFILLVSDVQIQLQDCEAENYFSKRKILRGNEESERFYKGLRKMTCWNDGQYIYSHL